jgi:hypothetical protein
MKTIHLFSPDRLFLSSVYREGEMENAPSSFQNAKFNLYLIVHDDRSG